MTSTLPLEELALGWSAAIAEKAQENAAKNAARSLPLVLLPGGIAFSALLVRLNKLFMNDPVLPVLQSDFGTTSRGTAKVTEALRFT